MILYGKLELTSHGLQFQSPQYEILPGERDAAEEPGNPERHDDDTLHTGRIVPIYEKTGHLTTKMQRVLVHSAIAQLPSTVPDPIPDDVRARQQLVERRGALSDVALPAGWHVDRRAEPRSAPPRSAG